MLYLNSDGVQLHRTVGKKASQIFIEDGKNALNPTKQLASYELKFKNDSSNSIVAATYFKMLKDISQSYSKEMDTYLSTQKENTLLSTANWQIIYNNIYNFSGKMNGNSLRVYKYFEANKNTFIKLHGVDSVEAVIDQVYSNELYFSSLDSTKIAFDLTKENYRKAGTKKSDRFITYADLHYYQSHKDWDNYATTAIEYIEKYAGNNPLELANDANNFYEHVTNKAQLEKAEAWAKKAVEINKDNFNFNATYACLLYKLEKKPEAKIAIEKSIELAKRDNADYSDLQKLLDTLK